MAGESACPTKPRVLADQSGTTPPILRSARQFFRSARPGGASDNSPVREHWERREGQPSPGTGRKIRRRVLLSPRSGARQFAMRTQGSRPGLFSFALRASEPFSWLRLATLWGGQFWPQAASAGSFNRATSLAALLHFRSSALASACTTRASYSGLQTASNRRLRGSACH